MWLTFCLSLALITALLVLPGTIALIAAGIPRWSSVACSPLVSVALYVIAGAITDTIGAHGSMPLLLCTAILSLAIAFPARALFARATRNKKGEPRRDIDWRILALYVVAGIIIMGL